MRPVDKPGVTRARVAGLIESGMTSAQISKALGIAPSTVAYHARMLGIEPKRGYALRYDWDAVQAYHDDGHSKRECADHFGFTSASWYDAVAAARLRGSSRGPPSDRSATTSSQAARSIAFT